MWKCVKIMTLMKLLGRKSDHDVNVNCYALGSIHTIHTALLKNNIPHVLLLLFVGFLGFQASQPVRVTTQLLSSLLWLWADPPFNPKQSTGNPPPRSPVSQVLLDDVDTALWFTFTPVGLLNLPLDHTMIQWRAFCLEHVTFYPNVMFVRLKRSEMDVEVSVRIDVKCGVWRHFHGCDDTENVCWNWWHFPWVATCFHF